MSEAKRTSVILDLRHGDSVRISDEVSVQLLHKSGHLARLRITAPRDFPIKMFAGGREGVPSMPTSEPS